MITFVDEKGTEHSALVAYSVTNAVNGELSVKGTIYTNDKVLHGIGRGWRFRLDDEYYRITYAKPNDTGRQIEVEFDAVHQFFYDMSKSMVYTTLNGSKPFETYLQAIFSNSGYTYNLETTVESIRKENFGNKSRLSLFNDIIKTAGLEFSVRGHVIRILKRVGTDLSTIVRKDFNMNELKIEKDINSFVTYQRGLGAWKDDEDHSKGRYETSYESPLSAIYGRIEAEPVVDERYKETGKLLERLKENVDKSYKVSVEIDMEDLSRAGYRLSRPNPGDYIMAINETLGFRQKVRIVSFTSEYDVGGNLISRKVVCNDIGTVQRATSEISHLSRTLTDSIEGSERALQTATRALVSADGKNTNYFGDVKPLDVPKGILRKGDRLFLTVGDKKQLYFWNGAEWELEPTEFDHEKFDMEFNRNSQEIKKTIQENRQKAEEALRNAGASTLLAQEAKRIGLDSVAKLEEFKKQATSAQMALSGDLDALKRTVASEVNQASEYRRTTTEALSRMTGQMNGFATKSEVAQGIDGLTETFAKMKVGGRNLWIKSKTVGAVIEKLPENHVTGQKECYRLENNSTLMFNLEPDFSSRLYQKVTYSAWIKFENVVQGQNSWNAFNCFKHYLFRKNSKTGIQNGPDYTTLGIYAGSSDWKYITFTYDYSENQNFDQLKTSLRFNLEGATSGTAWVTGIKVEIGSVATDWSLAPEDGENELLVAKTEFKKTADGLSAKMSAVESYVGQDSQRQEALRRYTREESAKQATSVRELVTRDFVGKSDYQEDVRGLERRFSAISTQTNNDIAAKIAQYKQTVDGRFASISSQIANKANQTDFQRVKETSQLYERILGNTENGIADKVARMALTNQLFQVEVGKYGSDGINRALNTSKGWTSFITIASPAGINLNADLHKVVASGLVAGDKLHVCLEISIDDVQPITGKTATAVLQSWGDVKKWNSGNPFGYRLGNLIAGNNWRKIEYDVTLTEQMLGNNFWWLNVRVDGASRYKVHTKLLKIEKGSRATPWSPAPEDTEEAIRTVQSQLAGSWAVQNLTSAGSIVSQINATNNQILIEAEKIRLKGKTLLDELTAIQGYFKRLFVGEGTFATLNTDILRANSITADKLIFDQAMANKFTANNLLADSLFSKQAFINRVQSVAIDASQVRSGILSGDRIYGGTIRGASIYGGTLTGHTQIQLGSYGSFDTVNGGLQINVPRDYNAKDGLGVQFIGSYGRGENVPYGLFIYKDSDFTTGGYASQSDEFLLTVEGYIKANGIGWMRTGKGSINGQTTATIGLWNSENVSLDFGGSANDIYYSYNGTAYSLWSVVNQHFSDRRLKDNIVDCKHKALDYIQQFQFKEYDWKKQEDRPQQAHTKIGLIAQEVQAVDPTLVYENGDTLNLDNLRLTNIALKAIQELALENQKLTHRLENLENERRTA